MKKIIFFLFFYLVVITGQAQHPAVANLKAEIEKNKNALDLVHASWGFCVLSVKTGEIIAQHNTAQSLIPASTFKIVITSAALGILGSDYRYKTRIEYDGLLDTASGVLQGNLYIRGSGDPSLGSELFKTKSDTVPVLNKWVKELKRKGIKKIEGAIIADAGIFDDELIPPTWIWGDMGNYYGAGACGLSYGENKYALHFKSGKTTGDSTWMKRTVPSVPGLKIRNEVKAMGKDDNAYIFGAPYSYERYVKGTIPPGKDDYEVYGSIPDPAWFCAYSFREELIKNGVGVEQLPVTTRDLRLQKRPPAMRRKLLFTHESPPLEEIIKWTNIKSNNLFAESLLKTISAEKAGYGTDTAGITLVKKYWTDKGLDLKGFAMYDGSGLSRMNSITVLQEAKILQQITKEPYFNAFFNSLPVAGRSGSLNSLCEGTLAENNLRAKSGYLTRARGYTGYVKNKKGELLCFSLLANNYECTPFEMKRKMEQLMIRIAELE